MHRLVVGAGIGVVVLGLAAVAATSFRPSPGRASDGPALSIAVFTPPPPPIQEGAVLEVGDLTDGYRHQPPPARAGTMDHYAPDDGWWSEIPADLHHEDPVVEQPAPRATVEPIERDSLGLGFEPVAAAERRVIRSSPPERTPAVPAGAEAPAPTTATGERGALFY